jgi:hypothetical protein
MILSIDFDGTIVRHRFPAIGEPLEGAFETLKLLQERHHLILWTCREDYGHDISKQYLTDAVDFCKENGVVFDAINEGIREEDFRPDDCLRRKPFAHYYIDDANFGGFPGWGEIGKFLLGKRWDELCDDES